VTLGALQSMSIHIQVGVGQLHRVHHISASGPRMSAAYSSAMRCSCGRPSVRASSS
jgi:hypothetical protein